MRSDLPRIAPAGDPGDSAGSSRPAPGAPAHRPSWFVLLSALMLAYGGMLLVGGLTALRDPQAAGPLPIAGALPPGEEVFLNQLSALSKEVLAAHTAAIRTSAAASLALALLMLYAAAAALARDRHGRAAALGAAWVGIIYQLGTLALSIPMARDYARASAPLFVQIVQARQDGGAAVSAAPDRLASTVQTLLVGLPVAIAVLGLAGSAVLIAYFGGRRGRALYGLVPPRGNR